MTAKSANSSRLRKASLMEADKARDLSLWVTCKLPTHCYYVRDKLTAVCVLQNFILHKTSIRPVSSLLKLIFTQNKKITL